MSSLQVGGRTLVLARGADDSTLATVNDVTVKKIITVDNNNLVIMDKV
jgi:hypothetical protein